ncbi:MAG TPA: response regulator [Solirubrobacteraceae bacterium]|jgi:two-component system phosphate regulon response regulator PhoB
MTRPRVLIVEDDPGLRLALEHGLDAEGFDVAVASDADGGCARAAELRPDLVLLDWVLPDGDDGTTVCRRLLRAHPEGQVVMLTGRTEREAERAALAAGARAFLTKGIALDALAAELRRLLAGG